MATIDPLTGLASSNTQNPITGVVTSDPITANQSGSQAFSQSSPTVVSNYNTQKKVNDITSTFQNYANTATPSFPTGTQRAVYAPSGDGVTGELIGYAGTPEQEQQMLASYKTQGSNQTSFGTNFTAPQGAQLQNDGTYLYQGNYYTKDQLASPESLAAISNTTIQQKKYDAALASQLDAINKRFDMYKQQQQAVTQSGAAGAQNALLQSGAGGRGSVAQYAAVTSDARVQSIMADGQRALQELDSQRDQLISAAQQAYQDKNYQLLSDLNTKIEKNRADMLSATQKSNEELAKQTIQAKKDTAIASIYDSGITNPTDIIKKLNEQGIKNVTAKDVTTTLELLTNQQGIDEIAKEIAKAGNDPSIIKGAKTVAEALEKAGTSLKSASNEVVKVGGNAYLIDKATGKIVKSFVAPSVGATGTGTGGTYKTDLDALAANAKSTISTKFGQEDFANNLSKARNDADKLNTIATVVLKNSPSPIREDFVNQTVGIKQIDKAIALLDSGVQTGRINAAKQYTYNLAGKDFDPELAQLNQLIVSAIQPYRNSVTGAAWGSQEEAEYQQLFGSTKYSPAELKQRLEGVKQIMKDKTTTALNAQVNPLGGNDLFATGGSMKGNLTDQQFVEQALASKKIKYEDVINGTQKGEIPVLDNTTGNPVYILINEYDPSKYTKL